MKEINLPIHNIRLAVWDEDPDNPGAYLGGEIYGGNDLTGYVDSIGDDLENTAANTIERLILAHAIAGVDVCNPAYLEGLETVIDAVANTH